MISGTYRLFHDLMKKGYVDRNDSSSVWTYVEDAQIRDELEAMGVELGFELIQAQDRLYLVPTQDNDLFLKNNTDYRSDIKGSDVRLRDLYLMNYLAVYILYLFFNGEGIDVLTRDFITKEELIEEFTGHCESVTGKLPDSDDASDDYSESFIALAEVWLGKKEGDELSKKLDDRYGILNRILSKFRADELFVEEDNRLKPAKKTMDLMPYVLRKDRISMINKWIEGVEDAADQ